MASLKKRARDNVTGRFSSPTKVRKCELPSTFEGTVDESPAARKRKTLVGLPDATQKVQLKSAPASKPRGRPRTRAAKPPKESKMFELSITVSVGGADVDIGLMDCLASFLEKETLAGKCSLERGATAYHLHFQMVVRIISFSMVAVSKLVKKYIGWDESKPARGVVICKALTQRGIHTFIGMVGYCMKDVEEDHYRTVDHNISADDLKAGLEQLAMHGQEESKKKIMLNQRNFALKCQTWRRWNHNHPAVIDWETEFFKMMKTGKFYPCTSWVVGGYGRGYDLSRMQSYWRMLLAPSTITIQDLRNVFSPPKSEASPNRKSWFEARWKSPPGPARHSDSQHVQLGRSSVQAAEQVAEDAKRKMMLLKAEIAELDKIVEQSMCHKRAASVANTNAGEAQPAITVYDVDKERSDSGLAGIVDGRSASKAKEIREGKRKVSPFRELWPAEWDLYASESSIGTSISVREPVLGKDVYIPVYKRSKPALQIG